MPALVVVKAEDTPLSGARAALAQASEQLAAANRALEEAQRPVARLSGVVGQIEQAEAGLAALRAQDDKLLGEWLANGDVSAIRPSPSTATLAAETKLIASQRDSGAAKAALPAAQEVVQRCAERVRDAMRAKETALLRVAVESLSTFCERRFLPAINDLLAIQAVAEGLEQRLWAEGRRGEGSTAVLSAAAEATEIIARTKREAGVPPNGASADRLLRQLASDPGAELEIEE